MCWYGHRSRGNWGGSSSGRHEGTLALMCLGNWHRYRATYSRRSRLKCSGCCNRNGSRWRMFNLQLFVILLYLWFMKCVGLVLLAFAFFLFIHIRRVMQLAATNFRLACRNKGRSPFLQQRAQIDKSGVILALDH